MKTIKYWDIIPNKKTCKHTIVVRVVHEGDDFNNESMICKLCDDVILSLNLENSHYDYTD